MANKVSKEQATLSPTVARRSHTTDARVSLDYSEQDTVCNGFSNFEQYDTRGCGTTTVGT